MISAKLSRKSPAPPQRLRQTTKKSSISITKLPTTQFNPQTIKMPPRPSTLISAFSAPSRLLYPSTRLISTAPEYGSTISRQPPRQPPRIDWDKTIESRKIFKEEFETRLQALRPQQPTSGIPGETQGAADGKDKMVEYLELVQTQYKFSQGDAYAPHDLSFQEQRKRRARKTPAFDAMDLLGINPIKEYRVCILYILKALHWRRGDWEKGKEC